MRKKSTAPRSREHRKASPTPQAGLIGQGNSPSPSASRRSALDNRSHRTLCVSAAAESPAGGTMVNAARSWLAHIRNPVP